MEQCTEWNAALFVNYVHFEKAFDSILREPLVYHGVLVTPRQADRDTETTI